MRIATALLFSVGVSLAAIMLASGQEKPAAADSVAPAIGLEIGKPAPPFANQTLKGPKGTVILFFRSADW